MNTELFIARRIVRGKSKQSISRPIVRIAIGGIAMGMAVMIVAIAIITGFKIKIREKVIGFSSHIQITSFDSNISYEPKPIDKNQPWLEQVKAIEGVKHVQVFATKAGIIKTKDEIEGIVLKGIGSDYDWSFFNDKIVEGTSFKVSDSAQTNDILISRYNAKKLKLKLHDNVAVYFIQDPPRMRKFTITGIYESGMDEFDKNYVIADIAHVQKLNDWKPTQIAGYEVLINNFDDLDKVGKEVYDAVGYNVNARTISEIYPTIFGWLEMQNVNAQIIIILMVIVAGINMISALLILILERTNMIGILKALGARNTSIRKIFIYNATYLIGVGLFWGNVIGIALCLVQMKFGIITLSQESYYMPTVPVNLDVFNILLLNAGTLLVCITMLILPSFVVSKISPVKAIRFD